MNPTIKHIPLLLLLFLCTSGIAQELSKERLEMMAKYSYKSAKSAIFDSTKIKAHEGIDFDQEHYFRKAMSAAEIENQIKHINSNASIELNTDKFSGDSAICLTSTLLSDGEYPYLADYKLDLIDNNLKEKGDSVKHHTAIVSNSSEEEINFCFLLKSKIIDWEQVNGNLTFAMQFVVGLSAVQGKQRLLSSRVCPDVFT